MERPNWAVPPWPMRDMLQGSHMGLSSHDMGFGPANAFAVNRALYNRAPASPSLDNASRLSTNPVVWRSGNPNSTLMDRQN